MAVNRKSWKDKEMGLAEAVGEYLHDGDSFTIGGMGARDPFAVAYEIIRQKKRHLTLTVPGVIDIGSMLVGSGCIDRFEGAYCGISVVGTENCFRRAREKGIPHPVEVEEYTNLTASLRFLAGSMKVPFMPTKSLLGSDIPTYNKSIRVIDDPYGSGPVALVRASNPDVAFIHVQRADLEGNGQIFGILVSDPTLARAAKHVVLTCEEIVPSQEIRKNPQMTSIPSYCVDAVVKVPFASHPMWCAGYYCCDIPFRYQFAQAAKTREGYDAFVKEWVFDTGSWDGFLDKLGRERLERLVQMERENYTIPLTYREGAM